MWGSAQHAMPHTCARLGLWAASPHAQTCPIRVLHQGAPISQPRTSSIKPARQPLMTKRGIMGWIPSPPSRLP